MKKILFIILFLPTIIFSQIVSETFNDWTMENDEYVIGHWVFDSLYHSVVTSDSMNKDLSDSLNHMTLYLGAWSSYSDMLDSCDKASPIYENGVVPNFSNASALKRLAADATDFNFDADDFTLETVIYMNAHTANTYLSSKGGGYSKDYPGLRLYHVSSGNHQISMASSDSVVINNIIIIQATVSAWHYLQITVDRSSNAIGYDNQYLHGSATIDISDDVGENISDTDDFMIGSIDTEGGYYDGYIAEVRISRGIVRSVQELREAQHLAHGWYSKAGKVYRDNLAFVQGFYDGDTVYYPVADGSNSFGSWQLSISAKGGKSGDVLTAWIGSATAVTQTLTTSSTTYTLDLGSDALIGDSLWFSASASDTVYIDNVTLTDVSEHSNLLRNKSSLQGLNRLK